MLLFNLMLCDWQLPLPHAVFITDISKSLNEFTKINRSYCLNIARLNQISQFCIKLCDLCLFLSIRRDISVKFCYVFGIDYGLNIKFLPLVLQLMESFRDDRVNSLFCSSYLCFQSFNFLKSFSCVFLNFLSNFFFFVFIVSLPKLFEIFKFRNNRMFSHLKLKVQLIFLEK